MGKFEIKDFLTENKLTESSRELSAVDGVNTDKGKEMLEYFENHLELDDEKKNIFKENLNSTNKRRLDRAYSRFQIVKEKETAGMKDINVINQMLTDRS